MTARARELLEPLLRRPGRLLGGALLAGLFFGNGGFRSLVSNWLELRRLRRDLAGLEAEERALAQRLREMRSGELAAESAARRELGYIKKGEIEYRFEPPARER